MSERREIELRLALYDDLAAIFGVMRSFALTELRRIVRGEEAQRRIVEFLGGALGELADALPPPAAAPMSDVWLLMGSVRGFCGSFNEDVLAAWRGAGHASPPAAVVVGERLQALVPKAIVSLPVAGALGGLDAPAVIDQVLAAIAEARRRSATETGLVACFRDEAGVQTQRLLPLPGGARGTRREAPLGHEPRARLATAVGEHYLFHSLLAILLRSVKAENHMRLVQMEGALRHLDESRNDLTRRRNRLRQEEIVEEIELMQRRPVGGAGPSIRW